MWTLTEAIARAGGALEGADCRFNRVVSDSRVDCAGALFVALRGPRFDGHDHVAAAKAAGAAAAMVEHPLALDIPQWVVEDTQPGLGRLAQAWRERLPGRVIALTGSNGKTTVKEMIAAILRQRGRVLATEGNLNNEIGMPLTLLKARDEDFVVLEMGANHPGEIGAMTDIARPEVAIITNAGRAHLEGFGSLDGVARAKGEIARGLSANGVLVIPGDAPQTAQWRELAGGHRVGLFAFDTTLGVNARTSEIQSTWGEQGFETQFIVHYGGDAIPLTLHLAGQHNVRNALAAIAAVLVFGIDVDAIRSGLATLRPTPGRLCPRRAERDALVIDDSYNANPDSIAAGIAVLSGLAGRRTLVLGDLGELGAEARTLHQGIGASARKAGVDRLFSVGELSSAATQAFGQGARHFDAQNSLIEALRETLDAEDRILIKGSRRARMELVVEALCPVGDA